MDIDPNALAAGLRGTYDGLSPDGQAAAHQLASEIDLSDLPNSHGGSFVSGLVHALRSGATLPGDVATGKVDPMSDEGIARAQDLAGTMMTGGLAGAEKDAVGVFGGRLAKTADHAALSKAEGLASSGTPREQIWNETGWFQGPDKQWRFEIPDNKARMSSELKGLGPKVEIDIQDALKHKALYDAYPDVASTGAMRWTFPPQYRSSTGGYSVKGDIVSFNDASPDFKTLSGQRSTALHELQHAVQQREGFASGGRTDPNVPYRQLAGEVEARNVQYRRDMTPEERRATPPWATQDVPDERQIVTRGTNDVLGNGVDGGSGGARPSDVPVPSNDGGVSSLADVPRMGGPTPDSLSPPSSLPMDEASRMGRAKELGYTRQVFHETKPENVDGLLGGGFDLSRRGAGYTDSEMPIGVFTKSHDRRIGVAGQDSTQMPLFVREGKQLSFPDRESLASHLRQDDQYRSLTDTIKRNDNVYDKQIDELWAQQDAGHNRLPPDKMKELDDQVSAILKLWQSTNDELAVQARQRSTDIIKSQGYDSLHVGHDPGFLKGKTDTTIILDPANVRHANAAFDPANEGKNMLLGSGGTDAASAAAPAAAMSNGSDIDYAHIDDLMRQLHSPQP